MSRLQLTFACGDYDRTRALEEGTVRPDGIDLTYLRLPVEETFFRMLRHQEFDVAEMSLASYVKSLDSRAALRGAAGLHVPAVPARRHLRERRRRHREARGPARQAWWAPRSAS